MKAFLVVVLLVAGVSFAARAQQADDRYIGIDGEMQQADHLAQKGDPGEALAAYTDAEKSLQQFQRMYPNWNPSIVNFRLHQMAAKIAALKKQVPGAGATSEKESSGETGAVAATSGEATPSAAANPAAAVSRKTIKELDGLRAQLQAERQANQHLQAKLKEALSVQPAAVDPRELAKAREKIRWLMKENALLKASQAGAKSAETGVRYMTNTRPLVVTNVVRVLVPDTNALEMARLGRAAAVRSLNQEHTRAEELEIQLKKLRQTQAAGTNSEAELVSLRNENVVLKNQLAALRSSSASAGNENDLKGKLKQARAQVASLQSEAEIAALEKKALERRLRELQSSTNATTSAIADQVRIQELTQQRDRLREQLKHFQQTKQGHVAGKNSDVSARIASLNDEVKTLRARLAVAEAEPSPFTKEELALFRSADPKLSATTTGDSSAGAMPDGTAQLVASAQAHFSHHQFDQAEADYRKILDRDQNNGVALANMAMIELQQGKLAEAEKHIKAALAQSPEDPYDLSTLGYLKLRQGKYNEALNALSRAAQLDPKNPEIQNYLGLTLSHKGERRQAESALRRAVQLNPKYAPAQNNLAVLYLSQKPPMPALARWHYEKALAAGQPRNPDLEKMLAEKGAPVSQQ